MTRAPSSLRIRTLLVASLLALAPLVSFAGEDPNDPNTPPSPLGDGNPCFDAEEVPGLAVFGDPNDPTVGHFDELSDCPSVCKKAGASCAKLVKRNGLCARKYADDRAKFSIKVDCDGLRGSDLKACKVPFEEQRVTERAAADAKIVAGALACTGRATACAEKCDVTP